MVHPYERPSNPALIEEEHYVTYWNPVPSKKQRVIAAFFLVLLLLATLGISLAIFLEERQKPSGERFSFDDLFDPTMKVQRKGVRWIEPDGTLTFLNNSDIYVQKLPSETPTLFLKGSDIIGEDGNPLSFFDYWISIDEQYVLLGTEYEKLWRHSYTAIYYIYTMQTKQLKKVSDERTQFAAWTPVGHSLAYVVGNDIYILKEDLETVVRVTNDGSLNVINGLPAWVYEEEVFGTNYALWWSTDGQKLAFLRSDETDVDIFYLTKYGKAAYPQQIPVKYPKPGYTNPTAELKVFDLASGVTSSPNFGYPEEEFLIVQVAWIDETNLAARLTNRIQNRSDFFRIETNSMQVIPQSKQASQTGWVEYSELYLIPSSSQYIEIVDHEGFNHIALYAFDSPNIVHMITEGPWEVTQIAGFHAPSRKVYYLSTEGDETERHLYSVSIDEGVSSRVRITPSPGFHSVSFSPAAGFYLLNYNGPDIPYQRLRSTVDPNLDIVLENNDALREKLAGYALPERTYLKVPITPNGDWTQSYEINCVMILPPDFDEREPRTYSVLHRVYGGPGSNLVQKTFTLDWHTYLSSSERYIVSMCDARGTAQRGNAFKHSVYKNLGAYEAYDQIEAIKFVQAYKYTRVDNTVVWGWSYGGYLTSKILEAAEPGLLVGGIAVAPVTDWRYYDTVYTERYMLTPQENTAGYDQSSVHNFTNINGTEYLLVHGTADDNVHFQHSLILINQLTAAGIDFDIHIYTDNDHAINTGANTQRDLYRRFTEYLMKLQ